MRTNHELFKILLEGYKKGVRIFICNAIDRLYNDNLISFEELNLLRKVFKKEKPTTKKNKKFYEEEEFGKGGGWFLVSNGEVCERRVKFLEMLVKKTKPKK